LSVLTLCYLEKTWNISRSETFRESCSSHLSYLSSASSHKLI